VGVRRVAVIAVLFSLFLVASVSGVVFASSENWVEVVRFTGGGNRFGATSPFVIDHVEWRIRWEYVPMVPIGRQNDFDFDVIPEENRIEGQFTSGMSIAGVNSPVEKNGTLYFPDLKGIFYLHTSPGNSEWTMIVEQNIDSIPEFPSWIVLPLFLTVTMVVAIYKKRLPKTSNN